MQPTLSAVAIKASKGGRRSAFLLIFALMLSAQASMATEATAASPGMGQTSVSKKADFAQQIVSQSTREIVDWVLSDNDNINQPFAIIDKVNAEVFVFSAAGHFLGSSPVLIGLAIGDDSIPGIGNRPLSKIRPEERTTPAGRFNAGMGPDQHGAVILWVDYDTAISLHRVPTAKVEEHRLQRLNSKTPLDNRITYGCINVAESFYKKIIVPTFKREGGVVYILPEVHSLKEVFPNFRS